MILDFACQDTRKLFLTGHSERFRSIEGTALRRLDLIQCACSVNDLRRCPSLCAPEGESCIVDASDGWNMCFIWEGSSVRGLRLMQKNTKAKTAKTLPFMDAERIVSHPGAILREEFMRPLKLSSNQISIAISVPVSRMLDIVNERRGISSDTAARLSQYLGVSARLWTSLQAEYELSVVRQDKQELLSSIKRYA